MRGGVGDEGLNPRQFSRNYVLIERFFEDV